MLHYEEPAALRIFRQMEAQMERVRRLSEAFTPPRHLELAFEASQRIAGAHSAAPQSMARLRETTTLEANAATLAAQSSYSLTSKAIASGEASAKLFAQTFAEAAAAQSKLRELAVRAVETMALVRTFDVMSTRPAWLTSLNIAIATINSRATVAESLSCMAAQNTFATLARALETSSRASMGNLASEAFLQVERQLAAMRQNLATAITNPVIYDDEAEIDLDDTHGFLGGWIGTVSRFMPIEVLEPALGDLREQCEQKRANGEEEVAIRRFLVMQAVLIFLFWLLLTLRFKTSEED
jgi:hypothetical protein